MSYQNIFSKISTDFLRGEKLKVQKSSAQFACINKPTFKYYLLVYIISIFSHKH